MNDENEMKRRKLTTIPMLPSNSPFLTCLYDCQSTMQTLSIPFLLDGLEGADEGHSLLKARPSTVFLLSILAPDDAIAPLLPPVLLSW